MEWTSIYSFPLLLARSVVSLVIVVSLVWLFYGNEVVANQPICWSVMSIRCDPADAQHCICYHFVISYNWILLWIDTQNSTTKPHLHGRIWSRWILWFMNLTWPSKRILNKIILKRVAISSTVESRWWVNIVNVSMFFIVLLQPSLKLWILHLTLRTNSVYRKFLFSELPFQQNARNIIPPPVAHIFVRVSFPLVKEVQIRTDHRGWMNEGNTAAQYNTVAERSLKRMSEAITKRTLLQYRFSPISLSVITAGSEGCGKVLFPIVFICQRGSGGGGGGDTLPVSCCSQQESSQVVPPLQFIMMGWALQPKGFLVQSSCQDQTRISLSRSVSYRVNSHC